MVSTVASLLAMLSSSATLLFTNPLSDVFVTMHMMYQTKQTALSPGSVNVVNSRH